MRKRHFQKFQYASGGIGVGSDNIFIKENERLDVVFTKIICPARSSIPFSEKFVQRKLDEVGIWDLGKRRTTLQYLNRWRVRQFEQLWQRNDCEIVARNLNTEESGLSLVSRFPECFRGRGLTVESRSIRIFSCNSSEIGKMTRTQLEKAMELCKIPPHPATRTDYGPKPLMRLDCQAAAQPVWNRSPNSKTSVKG